MANQNQDLDYKLIRLLQKNGRVPNTELAKELGVSEATVRNRFQRLTKEGSLQIVAVLNPFKLKTGNVGVMRIDVEISKLNHVGNELKKLDELWYVAQLASSPTFDAEYYVKSQNEIGQLLDTIYAIDGVTRVESSLIVRYIKNNWGIGDPRGK
jgi:Lrp/AsnC family transcriptional regulator for asnA, asnC and gidA